ncbi:hypothetical protein JI58_04765 [Marinosulfonomonas sp. PRT-SC04]|nr:hypothetical protein JI58_04765 [Marinosulfonomonas sp. PRT-SC04]
MQKHHEPPRLKIAPGFCQGATLMTDEGAQPVDWLRAGDRVMTRDHGFQKILWAERTIATASSRTPPQIRLATGCAGHNIPKQNFHLHPDHRILLKSPQIERLFAHHEAFVSASTVTNGCEIIETHSDQQASYFHILFKQHEIVLAEGLWVESFFPDPAALNALSTEQQTRIRDASRRRNRQSTNRAALPEIMASKTADPAKNSRPLQASLGRLIAHRLIAGA